MKKITAIILLTILSISCFAVRIEETDATRKVAFVAVSPADYTTRQSSLTNLVVYYSVDGSEMTLMTTPTATAMTTAGDFWLSIDEVGMITLPADCNEAELFLNISATEMATVSVSVELYRDYTLTLIKAMKIITDQIVITDGLVESDTIKVNGEDVLTSDEIVADIEAGDSLTGIKAQTDKLTFTGTDVQVTLNGEEVTTDSASREASKADVSALALQQTVLDMNNNIRGDITALNNLSESEIEVLLEAALAEISLEATLLQTEEDIINTIKIYSGH